MLLDALRGAAVAGHLAEHGVERHGSVGHADHAAEEGEADAGDEPVRALFLRFGHG